MKKVVLLLVVVASAVTVNAQKVKYGAKLGANILYRFTGSDADGFDESRKIKLGLAGGGFVNIELMEKLSLQPELLYSMEGNLQKEGDAKLAYNLGYINVPILIQYMIASGFFAETGPQIGFLISAKAKSDDGEDETTTDIKDGMKSTAFAWALGFGYRMSNGFGIGARYNMGLSKLFDADAKVQSSGLHVGVFYTFGGKK